MTTVKTGACVTKNTAKNPCKKDQGLPKNITTYFLHKKGFSLPENYTEADISAAIISKDLQVGYKISGSIEEAIENGITNTSTGDYRSSLAQHRATIKHILNAYQQSVLRSWENVYSGIYFGGEDRLLHGEFKSDGTFQGLPIYSSMVEARTLPGGESTSDLIILFKSNERSSVASDIDFTDIEGIYNLEFDIISASATEIKFKAKACCDDLTTLETADVTFTSADGTAQAVVLNEANGVYTASGTGLVSGTLATAGVVDKTEFIVEGSVDVTIS